MIALPRAGCESAMAHHPSATAIRSIGSVGSARSFFAKSFNVASLPIASMGIPVFQSSRKKQSNLPTARLASGSDGLDLRVVKASAAESYAPASVFTRSARAATALIASASPEARAAVIAIATTVLATS